MGMWIEFENYPSYCVVLPWRDKIEIETLKGSDGFIDPILRDAWITKYCAEHAPGAVIKAIYSLPYAAFPIIGPNRDMTFCFQPELCKGRGSCPRQHACCD